MSKYIKLYDAIMAMAEWFCEPFTPTKILSDLPTIEVSEDFVKDTDVPNSEDCISREWVKGICEYMLDEEMLGHMLGHIEDAPSVVPSCQKNRQVERAEGEWKWKSQDICDNCGYEIPHLKRTVGDTVLMDSKDWNYCPNCGARMKG